MINTGRGGRELAAQLVVPSPKTMPTQAPAPQGGRMAIMGWFHLYPDNFAMPSHTLVMEAYMRWMLSGVPTGEHVNRHYWNRRFHD